MEAQRGNTVYASRLGLFAGIVVLVVSSGCSVRKFAINKLGDSLASSGTTFASDEDVELIGTALPFSLKLIESLLAESPRHKGLLEAAASGFTQYTYVYVQQDADQLEDTDVAKAAAARLRARRLYLRARDYGLRGLSVNNPQFAASLKKDPKQAVLLAGAKQVGLLYWTAAAWGAAISVSKDDPDLIADQPAVEALIDRALALNEGFDSGALHAFLITYEPSRIGGKGDPAERARQHFNRAVELSAGKQAGVFVSLAESVSIPKQNRKEFQTLLERALAVDVNARPEWRLANVVMQRRARWLLSRSGEIFLE